MTEETLEYDFADVLAAMNQFRLLDDAEPEFYEKNFHNIKFGTAAILWWSHHDNQVRLMFSLAAQNNLDEAAQAIRATLREFPVPQDKLEGAVEQLGLCLPALYRVTQDPELPQWLGKAKVVIDSFFQEQELHQMKQTTARQTAPRALWMKTRNREEIARLLRHLTDQEQTLLFAASRLTFDAMSNHFQHIRKIMQGSTNIANTVGQTAALLCWHAAVAAEEKGLALSSRYFVHEGVLAQAIDSLSEMADRMKLWFSEFERQLASKIAMQNFTRIAQGEFK